MNKKVCVILLLLIACVLFGYGKNNNKNYSVAANVSNKPIKVSDSKSQNNISGKMFCILAKQKDAAEIRLYVDDSNKEKQCYHVVSSGKTFNNILISYTKHSMQGKDFACDFIPFLDMIYNKDTIKMIIQDDCKIYYIEKNTKDKNSKLKIQEIYVFRWIPDLYNGILNEAKFVTPDIIRLANTTGAAYNLKITYKNGNPVTNLIWKNNKGEKITSQMSYPNNNPKISAIQPRYAKDALNNWTVMESKARKIMFKKLNENAKYLRLDSISSRSAPYDLNGIKIIDFSKKK